MKMHAFVALLLVSFAATVATDIPVGDAIEPMEEGMGGILGFVAIVVGMRTRRLRSSTRTAPPSGRTRLQWALAASRFENCHSSAKVGLSAAACGLEKVIQMAPEEPGYEVMISEVFRCRTQKPTD